MTPKPLKTKSLPRKPFTKSSGGLLKPRLTRQKPSGRIKPKKVPQGTEAWIKAIPMGLHGSGHLQKRLWRLTSDFCRIRDFHQFEGRCVATGTKLSSWNDGQAGHFKNWNKCNGMYKFCRDNIHLQTAQSNSFPDKDTWKNFEKELVRRYGQLFVDNIDADNELSFQKITNEQVIEEMQLILKEMQHLPEQPKYYSRVTKLLNW